MEREERIKELARRITNVLLECDDFTYEDMARAIACLVGVVDRLSEKANKTKSGTFAKYVFDMIGSVYKVSSDKQEWIPSTEQRDWSKFTAPWYKKDRFDLKTLQPFDKVLVKVGSYWRIELFSHMYEYKGDIYYACVMSSYKECIPYNDETKRLVNTSEEAPKFYRNWEDW